MENNPAAWQDPGFVFVLVEPSHSGNIGAAARALAVMGFGQRGRLRVVSPRFADFAQNEEALAFASNALDVLRSVSVFPTLEQAISDCCLAIAVSAAGREFSSPPESPEALLPLALREASLSAPVAWVFGTERTGLSIAQAQRCQKLCSIQANPDYASLNLAQAIQVIAYVLRQGILNSNRTAKPMSSDENQVPQPEGFRGYATQEQIEGLMQQLERTVIQIGYLNPDQPKRLMPRLRRLFSRTRLELEEVDILRGILGKVEKNQRTGDSN